MIEVKEKLGHGNFNRWLGKEFSWSDVTARRLMMVAKEFKSYNMNDLDIVNSALYILASPSTPEEAKTEAIERAKSGERITSNIAKGIKSRHKFSKKPKKKTKTRKETSSNTEVQKPNSDRIDSSKLVSKDKEKTEQPKPQILAVNNVPTIKNSFWQLGREGYMFCGQPDDTFFINKLPNVVPSTIIYSAQKIEADYSTLLEKSQSRITFGSIYDSDLNKDNISVMIENWLHTNTDGGDTVVFAHLFDLSLLRLAVQMGCSFFLAEPDIDKAQFVLDSWTTTTTRIT